MATQLDNKLALGDWGGIDIISDPEHIQDNKLTICDNFIFGDDGTLRRRNGASRNMGAGSPFDLFSWFLFNSRQSSGRVGTTDLNSANRVFVGRQFGAAGQRLYHSTDLANWGAIATTDTPFSIAYIQNKAFFADSGGIRSWDGVTLSAVLANTPAASQTMISHRNRLWATGTRANMAGHRIHYSDANAPEVFQGSSTIDVGPGDDGYIRCIAILNDVIYMFKQNSVWALYNSAPNPADWIARKVISNVGCIADNQVVEYQGALYFISSQGIMKTDGVNVVNISSEIIDSNTFAVLGFQSTQESATLNVFKDWLVLTPYWFMSAPNNAIYNPKLWIYDFTRNSWFTWSFSFGAPRSVVSILGPDMRDLVLGYGGEGLNLRTNFSLGFDNVTQDDETNFLSKFRTKHLSIDPYSMKRFKNLNFRYDSNFAAAADVNVYGLADRYLDSGTISAVTLLSMGAGDLSQSGSLNGRARQAGSVGLRRFRKIAFEVQTSGNGPFTFYDMQLNYTVARRIGRASYRGEAATDA